MLSLQRLLGDEPLSVNPGDTLELYHAEIEDKKSGQKKSVIQQSQGEDTGKLTIIVSKIMLFRCFPMRDR